MWHQNGTRGVESKDKQKEEILSDLSAVSQRMSEGFEINLVLNLQCVHKGYRGLKNVVKQSGRAQPALKYILQRCVCLSVCTSTKAQQA